MSVSGTFLFCATTFRSMRGPSLRTSRGPQMNASLYALGPVATYTESGTGRSGSRKRWISVGSTDSRNGDWLFEPRMYTP